jgi:NTP pyrophosphatase (non-canonical NTP hydrolase)
MKGEVKFPTPSPESLCYDFTMEMRDLTEFARLQEQKFKILNAGKNTPLERRYAQLAKLGEEYGELCEAILAADGHQRQEKMAGFTQEHLASEMADVVITLSILAANFEIDLPSAIEKKITIINERFKDVIIIE